MRYIELNNINYILKQNNMSVDADTMIMPRPDDMDIRDIPFDTPLWSVAYDINNKTERGRTKSKPIKGIIEKHAYDCHKFKPYKKDSTEFRKSGIVHYKSRLYTETYKEAVDLYNELVDIRIAKLQHLAADAAKDKIKE